MGQYLRPTYLCTHAQGVHWLQGRGEGSLPSSTEPEQGAWPHLPFWVAAE